MFFHITLKLPYLVYVMDTELMVFQEMYDVDLDNNSENVTIRNTN